MNERPFQRRVEDMATRFGWKWWHVPSPMRHDSKAGFVGAREAARLPDLILIHDDPPRLVFMELKGDSGKLSDRQRDFLHSARAVKEAVQTQYILAGMYDPPVTPLGVYAFWPKDEPAIEQLLRTKVLA